jgi:DNA-binding MarR family transcriptional regulator
MPTTLQREIGKRHPFDSPAEEAFLNIARAAATLEASHEAIFKSHGLSGATYNILRILRGEQLAGNRSVPMATIGERLIARVPDVTRLVDRLERARLVERCRTPRDRRLVLVSMTDQGLALLGQIEGPLEDLLKAQFAHMTPDELSQLSTLLVKARSPERPPGAPGAAHP